MLLACSRPDSGQKVIRIGLSHSQGHSFTQALEQMAKTVAEESEGKLQVKIYPSSRLGSEKEMQEMLSIGSLDMAITGLLNTYDPLFSVFEMPYLYRDRRHVKAVFQGPDFRELAKGLEPFNIQVIGFYENGFRNITTSRKPIHRPQDLKGMLIRVPENAAYVATFEALGALPTTLSFSELYTALMQGVVDGQENPLQNIWYGRLYEAQQHLALTRHIYNAAYILAGTRFWQRLSPDEQALIQRAIDTSIDWQLGQMALREKEFAQKLQAEGVQFTYPDRGEFARAAAPAYDKLAVDLGPAVYTLATSIRQTGLFPDARVLYVNSYHRGYPTSDAIEDTLLAILHQHKVQTQTFYLDSKRNPQASFLQDKAAEIRSTIDTWQPDVLLVSDDNAVKYLVEPFFKDDSLPVLFCGVNWDASQYGLPTQDVTGMLEVLPLRQSLSTLKSMYPQARKLLILTENSQSARNNKNLLESLYQQEGWEPTHKTVSDAQAWQEAYLEAQEEFDAIYLPTNGAIQNWEADKITAFVQAHTRIPTFTCDEFMMRYSVYGQTKIAAEQGAWLAQRTLDVLSGFPIRKIPLTENQASLQYVNPNLAEAMGFSLPDSLRSDLIFYETPSK